MNAVFPCIPQADVRKAIRRVALQDLRSQADDCFYSALSGHIVKITENERAAILIGDQQWRMIVKYLEMLSDQ